MGTMRNALLAGAALGAILISTPAGAQETRSLRERFEAILSRLTDPNVALPEAAQGELDAYVNRQRAQGQILVDRLIEASRRCDIPTMQRIRTLLEDMRRLLYEQRSQASLVRRTLLDYSGFDQLLQAYESFVLIAQRQEPRNCPEATEPQQQLTTGPTGEQVRREAQSTSDLFDVLDRVSGIRPDEALQRAREAAERCDREGLERAIRDLIDLLDLVVFSGDPGFQDYSVPAPIVAAATAEVSRALTAARNLALQNCPEATEPQTQVTTGPTGEQIQETTSEDPLRQISYLANIAWTDGIDAADRCDQPGVSGAITELEQLKARAETIANSASPSADPTAVQAYQLAIRIQQYIDQVRRALYDCYDRAEREQQRFRLGDLGLQLAQDSGQWCTFGTSDPRDLPTDGDDPRDAPGSGRPGDDPRDRPTGGDRGDPRDTPGQPGRPGDDPRDRPTTGDRDDPRDRPTTGGPSTTPRPGGPAIGVPPPPGGTRERERDRDDPRDQPEEPREPPRVTITAKSTGGTQVAPGQQQAVSGQQVRLFPESVRDVALPSEGGARPQTDASADPLTCTTGADGTCTIELDRAALPSGINLNAIPASGFQIEVEADQAKSYNILVTGAAGGRLLGQLERFVISTMPLPNDRRWITVLAQNPQDIALLDQLIRNLNVAGDILEIEENLCRTKAQGPNDPHFRGRGAWGQREADQWAIQRVGLTAAADSAWAQLGPNPQPVIVAVIDSGLDWNHLDFSWSNIWRNPREIPGNGIDDDGNGYVDDIIGWDFLGNHNNPWDHDGHGTLVAGIIAADSNNGIGIAGINPHARIMVLKALNAFGHSRASFIAHAIKYAADNGARIINISASGPGLTGIERDAIAYARSRGAIIVVAAGNDGANVEGYGPAANEGVVTVAATAIDDSHPSFSNWGPGIDVAAPGVDVLSLRARRTDTVRGVEGVPYRPGEAYVGADRRYYRATGTSFAAPIVSGVASLILSRRPELTAEQVETILIQSAQDIQTPGRDNFSGAGMVDARAALGFDPSVRVEAAISGVEVVQGAAGPAVRVNGTIAADRLASARIDIGAGREPREFRTVAPSLNAATGALAEIPADNFRGSRFWTIRLVVTHANGTEREARFLLDVGG